MNREMMFPEPCIVHLASHEPDCELCLTELLAINNQQSDTDRETASIINQIEMQGYEVDPLVYIATKLDTLIDSLTGKNPKARAKFDATVSVNVLRVMVQQQAEVARERLLS